MSSDQPIRKWLEDFRMEDLERRADELKDDPARLAYWRKKLLFLTANEDRFEPIDEGSWDLDSGVPLSLHWLITEIEKKVRGLESRLGTEVESPAWPSLQEARANSDWGPLVQFLAKAMQEAPAASRTNLAIAFGNVCEHDPKARDYCERKGLSPAAIPLDVLSRYKKEAKNFLESLKRQSSEI